VRTGLASDIEVLDEFPSSYVAYTAREHRWIRGDWQIADWVLPSVPARGGGRAPNPLNALNRWKILDNLRRSLVPAAAVLLLVLSWLALPAPAWTWSALVALAVFMPAVLGLIGWAVSGSMRDLASREAWSGIGPGWMRALLTIASCPTRHRSTWTPLAGSSTVAWCLAAAFWSGRPPRWPTTRRASRSTGWS
jgi:hypothetical protein